MEIRNVSKIAVAGAAAATAVVLAGVGRVESQTQPEFKSWNTVLQKDKNIWADYPVQLDRDPEVELVTLEGGVSGNVGGRHAIVYDFMPDSRYEEVADVALAGGVVSTAFGDYSGDGKIDMATCMISPDGTKITIYEKETGLMRFKDPVFIPIETEGCGGAKSIKLRDGSTILSYVSDWSPLKAFDSGMGIVRRSSTGDYNNYFYRFSGNFINPMLAVGDVTHDQNEDVTVYADGTWYGNPGHQVVLWAGDGKGSFADPQLFTFENPRGTSSIIIGKLGADSQNSIFISGIEQNTATNEQLNSITKLEYLQDKLIRTRDLTSPMFTYVPKNTDLVNVDANETTDIVGNDYPKGPYFCPISGSGEMGDCEYIELPEKIREHRLYWTFWKDQNGDGKADLWIVYDNDDYDSIALDRKVIAVGLTGDSEHIAALPAVYVRHRN